MEMEERRRFDDGKIGRAPDFFLDNAASLILAGMRDAGRKSGYLPEFIEASVRHFDRCGECRRSVRDAVRLNVRMRKELRGPFDHLSDEESDRFIAGIMERIRNLPEDRPRGLRLMKGGRDGAKRP